MNAVSHGPASATKSKASPSGFFHFSGYSPAARHVLSRHQVERPRICLSDHPELVRIFNEYGDALESAGYGGLRRGSFADTASDAP